MLYGELQNIMMPPIPFYIITIDFILALPVVTPNRFDCLLTIMDKFSKRIALALGKVTWKAKDWVNTLLDAMVNWGILRVIIFDRDLKFLLELWQAVFKKLEMELLVSTIYYLQIDRQLE